MAGIDHGQAHPAEQEDMVLAARNARLGMVLFVVYLLVYSGFVAINAFWPQMMNREALFGVNLAVTYGFVLIVAAIVMAFLYCWLCRARAVSD